MNLYGLVYTIVKDEIAFFFGQTRFESSWTISADSYSTMAKIHCSDIVVPLSTNNLTCGSRTPFGLEGACG